jgi:hypothetical protein
MQTYKIISIFPLKKITPTYLQNNIHMTYIKWHTHGLQNTSMSEWLLFNANSAIVKLYHGENKLIFNEMMMRSALYYTNTLSCIFFIVLAHWNNSPRVDLSLHSDTLFWFRDQSLLVLLNAACLAEKQQIPIS